MVFQEVSQNLNNEFLRGFKRGFTPSLVSFEKVSQSTKRDLLKGIKIFKFVVARESNSKWSSIVGFQGFKVLIVCFQELFQILNIEYLSGIESFSRKSLRALSNRSQKQHS